MISDYFLSCYTDVLDADADIFVSCWNEASH